MIAHYNLIRGLHIIAVIAWMAGMLYLPRLYVYHTRAEPGSVMDETFKEMERKLLRIIINPAMLLVLLLGGALISIDLQRLGPNFWTKPWFVVKLCGVALLFAWHGFLARARRAFAENRNSRSERFWRMSNELPFVVAIVIVLSATTKYGA
ncbi:MAG: CopD family protein [Caulobacteraceae bacterium]|nr:CopD family protein [Caulobacteraceae bacterium]